VIDTCKKQPERLDFDNTINLSSLIVNLVDDPPVLIMTPFLIILKIYWLTEVCESFLDHPIHCRLLPVSSLGRKPRLDLTFTEDETERVIGVLILSRMPCGCPCGCEVNSPYNRSCGTRVVNERVELVPRMPQLTYGCPVNWPHNRTCGPRVVPCGILPSLSLKVSTIQIWTSLSLILGLPLLLRVKECDTHWNRVYLLCSCVTFVWVDL
jgi:hypothetical protein